MRHLQDTATFALGSPLVECRNSWSYWQLLPPVRGSAVNYSSGVGLNSRRVDFKQEGGVAGEFGGWSLCRHVPISELCEGVTAWGKLARDVSKLSTLVISIMNLPFLVCSVESCSVCLSIDS